MNRDEAKTILLLYRSDADALDPQVARALEFMKSDSDLRGWFDDYLAQQKILREKFRQILAPPGLKEQIISEHKALSAKSSRDKIVAAVALAAIAASLAIVATVYYPRHQPPTTAVGTFAAYQGQMTYLATTGYPMNLATNDLTQIRGYLAQNQSPADYVLPASLEKTAATGCAVESFQDAKVSMICFRTGKPLAPNQAGDLWLFVAPDNAVQDPPASATPQITQAGALVVATWTRDGKFYLLATAGNPQTIQKYL